ncbi:MAG: tetratricopeptide repeat protein [Candidatus Xenobia bacterium]
MQRAPVWAALCLLLMMQPAFAQNTTYDRGLRDWGCGRVDAATAEFRVATRADVGNPMPHLMLSRCLLQQHKVDAARQEMKAARKLAGQATDAQRFMLNVWQLRLAAVGARSRVATRTLQAARRLASLAIAVYPDDVQQWLLRAELEPDRIRALPFYLAAHRIDPQLPLPPGWQLAPPPIPAVKTVPWATSAPIEQPILFDGLGQVHFTITAHNAGVPAWFKQGMCCHYAYVWPVAAQAFRYALTLDPHCSMACWGLSFCQLPGKATSLALARACVRLATKYGSPLEQRLGAARVLQLQSPTVLSEAAQKALAGCIAAAPDNADIWVWVGLAYKDAGEQVMELPYCLAAARIQPDHPGANHELVHGYEAIQRPMLGWDYALAFAASAPNMPHAQHMIAHLATRLARWDIALTDCRRSVQLSLAGYPDDLPEHHMEVFLRILAHQGHFEEAAHLPPYIRDTLAWGRMLQLRAVPADLSLWAHQRREKRNGVGWYLGSLVDLDAGKTSLARDFLRRADEVFPRQTSALARAEAAQVPATYLVNEVQGRLDIAEGHVDRGLLVLQHNAQRATQDYNLHQFGEGAYPMETWGEAALATGRWDQAVTAFSEALAHENASIVGALGMQVVCEVRGDRTRAASYAAQARQIWHDADEGALDRLLAWLRSRAARGHKAH